MPVRRLDGLRLFSEARDVHDVLQHRRPTLGRRNADAVPLQRQARAAGDADARLDIEDLVVLKHQVPVRIRRNSPALLARRAADVDAGAGAVLLDPVAGDAHVRPAGAL